MDVLIHNEKRTYHHGLSRLGLDQQCVRVLVVGLGVTGLSVVKFLQQNDIRVAVIDSRDNPPSLEKVEQTYPNLAVFTGGFDHEAFEAATHIIVSPGVRLDIDEIQLAAERGIPVFGDIDVFAVCADAPIAAITGSNGKSTVTTLLGDMAVNTGWDVRVGGNLGTPALDLLSDKQADLYVLELSSFQLERTSKLKADVVALLNISDDHMDRYSDITDYRMAKERICHGEGVAVLNRQDSLVKSMLLPRERRAVLFGLDEPKLGEYGVKADVLIAKNGDAVLNVSELKIKGSHNVKNALSAMAMADALNIPRQAQQAALQEFPGLAHRTQWITEIAGVTWINDSKATNPGACLAALEGLGSPIILIAGGDGKGADFAVLADAIENNVSLLILMGRDADRMKKEAAGSTLCALVETIEEAVSLAAKRSVAGETVLLSPACASLDQFENYQQRGNRFVDAVKGLAS
ncbi:MAG TPA: UDP-N-acetylmuramoyl-L-alanine--D-glutamate ligase [Cycloclasticus sp.]|nr:UDP-N-acetylmuramoyl-L-alanine--D-glutamate ligase [Cycloclasticus sp.]